MRIRSEANERKAHQRRRSEIKTGFSIGADKRSQAAFLFRGRELAPVVITKRERCFRVHALQRMIEALPVKGSSEDRVMIYHALPGAFEKLNIQFAVDFEDDLFEIESGLGRIEAVKEHARLQRRQWKRAVNLGR